METERERERVRERERDRERARTRARAREREACVTPERDASIEGRVPLPPPEGEQIVLLNCLYVCHKSPDSGALLYT
jgi:hypothetical protein